MGLQSLLYRDSAGAGVSKIHAFSSGTLNPLGCPEMLSMARWGSAGKLTLGLCHPCSSEPSAWGLMVRGLGDGRRVQEGKPLAFTLLNGTGRQTKIYSSLRERAVNSKSEV